MRFTNLAAEYQRLFCMAHTICELNGVDNMSGISVDDLFKRIQKNAVELNKLLPTAEEAAKSAHKHLKMVGYQLDQARSVESELHM